MKSTEKRAAHLRFFNRLCDSSFYYTKKEVQMSETKTTDVSTQSVDISTTATIRESMENHADEPVMIIVPIGGDTDEFE